jgi:hypothetical protein
MERRYSYPFIGDRDHLKAKKVANWIGSGTTKPCSVKPFHFAEEGLTEEMIAILRGDIILDCLPGSQQESPNLLKIMSCITPT